jgi:hypothetical protein
MNNEFEILSQNEVTQAGKKVQDFIPIPLIPEPSSFEEIKRRAFARYEARVR